MKFLKKLLRKNEKPLQQIDRRLNEHNYPSNKRKKGKNELYPQLLQKINRSMPLECSQQYKKLKFANYELSNQTPDNCCFLKNGSCFVIDFIGKKRGETVIVGRQFEKLHSIENYPMDSTLRGIGKAMELSELKVVSAEEIEKKACLFKIGQDICIVPLLHH
ncbi:hypothetical protein TKK_0010278 [Trichogramma kaykai]|uniref:Uncharacterized protein n=1 Tax=Trichogramma kaykai TaxID=54128 RepID=A0ABD2X097_9HYME